MHMKSTKNRDSEPDSSEKAVRRKARLKLTVQYAVHPADVPARPEFRKWVKAALAHDAEIVLRIVDEAEGRSLNRDFRGKDYATNVLTFGYGDDAAPCWRHCAVRASDRK